MLIWFNRLKLCLKSFRNKRMSPNKMLKINYFKSIYIYSIIKKKEIEKNNSGQFLLFLLQII
jgi:hypothetical protein